MHKATVSKIRPVSWKISVQGKEQAEFVRKALAAADLESTECTAEPDLMDPPTYSFVASLRHDSPLNSAELQSVLENHGGISVNFDSHERNGSSST